MRLPARLAAWRIASGRMELHPRRQRAVTPVAPMPCKKARRELMPKEEPAPRGLVGIFFTDVPFNGELRCSFSFDDGCRDI